MWDKSNHQKHFRQIGFSLIEILLVISVIGAGAAIAYIVGNKRIQASQADKAQLTLTQMSKSIEGIASTNLDYAMLSTSPANAIPVSLIDPGGQLKPSPWGAIALATNSGAKAHESYSISFSDVPPYGCVALASKGYDGFAVVEINGTIAWQSGSLAPDPAALSNVCQQSVNVVKFTSQKMKGDFSAPSPFIRTVYPPATICLPPMFWNTITGICDNPPTACTPPQIWDAASSSCKTPIITCTPPQYLASTAAGVVCVGPGACTLPQVWNAATSACITPPVICTPPQVFDAGTGGCITPPVICTPPQVLDTATNTCKTPPVVCTPPQVLDTATNTCVTPPAGVTCGGSIPDCISCHAACVGPKLADGCFDAGNNLIRTTSNPTWVDGLCGFTLPPPGTIFDSVCSSGTLINLVSDGPGVGFHYTYGSC